MCGIAGAFWDRRHAPSTDRLARALSTLTHRGPDATGQEVIELTSGWLQLGHTRLSIIDLSSSGNQPMRSADGRYLLTYNGEIYNYQELRAELEQEGKRFHTSSDTEVLLAAWTHWGPAALSRLVGMFAFAIFDQVNNTLDCARDAFGIKPLYYAHEGKDFLFASEPKALTALRRERPQLNWQQAYDYLAHGDYDASESSFAQGMRQIQPGHWLSLQLGDGSVRHTRWWTPHVTPVAQLSLSDATEVVREKFLNSLRLHLRSDVPLGTALSGGIDSSAIVCGMRHLEPDAQIHTFSFIAQGSESSEEHWVDLVNRHVGSIAHKVVAGPAELARDLDALIAAQGEPFGSTSIYAQYRVFQLAGECGITVTLDGQGADELLAGYHGYVGQRMHSLLDQHKYGAARRFLREWSTGPGRGLLAGLKATVAECTSGHLYDLLRQLHGAPLAPAWLRMDVLRDAGVKVAFPAHAAAQALPGRRVIAELADALTRRGLPALLRHGDRNAMRFSVESRVPFLTTDLADFLLTLPEHYLIAANGETKSVLRAALRGIVPDAILDRRDKIGFATPERQWLEQIAPQAREWLREETGLPFLDQRKVLEAFDAMMSGQRAFSWQAWRWINFIRWYNRHMKA